MKHEKFLSAMNDIADDYIKEAADFQRKKPNRARSMWIRYGSLAAACLVVCLAAVALLPGTNTGGKTGGSGLEDQDNREVLPQITVENYTARMREPEQKLGNPSEDREGNPWVKDAEIETLPVYENIAYAGEADQKAVPAADAVLDQEIMMKAAAADMTVESIRYCRTPDFRQSLGEETAVSEDAAEAQGTGDMEKPEETAGGEAPDGAAGGAAGNPAGETALGKEDGKASDTSNEKAEVSFAAVAQTDSATITATCSNFTRIEYTKPQTLPEPYTAAQQEMTGEKAKEIAEYLLDQYGQLMGFSNPKASVRMFYDSHGNPQWILAGYDGCENLQEQIISYNLKRMRFELNEAGQLTGIMMADHLASGKVIEEYPIITAEEAKMLLEKGKYVANSEEPPETANIAKEELVYLTGPECNIFMPYYAFDVQLAEEGDGLMRYSTYYVPAVQQEYLNKMPGADEPAK